jgi:hypothetical protein
MLFAAFQAPKWDWKARTENACLANKFLLEFCRPLNAPGRIVPGLAVYAIQAAAWLVAAAAKTALVPLYGR